MSRHGVFIREEATALTVPITGYSAVQVVIGTAPINMLDNPAEAVNIPILATKATEAMEKLGYCTEFSKYTLCQTMYVTNNIYQVSPAVYINVLDPQKHKKALEETEVSVDALRAVVKIVGILREGLTVTAGETELTLLEDYTVDYDAGGYLAINLVAGGAGAGKDKLSVTGYVLDPDAVTKEDVIGAYDPTTGKETGMELGRTSDLVTDSMACAWRLCKRTAELSGCCRQSSDQVEPVRPAAYGSVHRCGWDDEEPECPHQRIGHSPGRAGEPWP